MAVIDEVPGVRVHIKVRGQALTEYDDDEETGIDHGDGRKIISKYIEAINDEDFSVHCVFDSTYPYTANDILACVYVDGKYLEAGVRYARELRHGTSIDLYGHRFQKSGQWFQKNFSFSKLSIVEEHTQQPSKEMLSTLQQAGLVSIRVCRVIVQGEELGRNTEASASASDLGDISEKALKGRALSHAVGLKPKQSLPKVLSLSTKKIDPTDKPLLTSDFKYRSRDALVALCVIPREPTPIPLEERDVDTLSVAELRELTRLQQERLAAQQHIKPEVKRERDTEDDDGEIEVEEARPVKKRVLDTIDLTDD